MMRAPVQLAPTDEALFTDLEFYCAIVVQIKTKTGEFVPFVWNREQRYIHERLEEQRRKTGKVRDLILKGGSGACRPTSQRVITTGQLRDSASGFSS
jgi:hypothetical protein